MIKIAIDGFPGCGKSTMTKLLAEKLGSDFKVLNTGAIFRAFAYAFKKGGYGEMTEENVLKLLKDVDLKVIFFEDEQHQIVNGEDVTTHLRDEDVGILAAKISVFPNVREKYLKIAKDFAKENNCLMEGRDIGSVVMPDADVKLFMTADPKIRAERRYKELLSKNIEANFEEVLKGIKERDEVDINRKYGALKPCLDSVIVDNSNMDLDETVEYCMKIIEEKINNKKINIAIDGYVCSGKSTIAKALAKRLGFKVFDTGAIYRGVACAFDYMNYDENKISEEMIKEFSRQINVHIEFSEGVQHVFVNGIDHTPFLRTEKTSILSAKISPFPCIREIVLNLQRSYAKENNLVMEGRDIGSYVLPDADFKFFCTADENVRAKRRYEQQRAMGNDVDFDNILKELKERDYKDTHRDHGAIKKMPDSIVVDTTHQSLEQSVDFCLNCIKEKYPNFSL